MKISVVTVAYNSAKTIGRTIASFLDQTHPDKELIVIDGASSDTTVAIARSFGSEQIRILSERDDGIYSAMNKGLTQYTGEAVGFLNSDDCFKGPDALTRLAEGLAGADIVYGNLDFVSGSDREKVVRRWRGAPFRKRAFVSGWMPPHPTFYIRRAVVAAVGHFDVRYSVAADYDYMLRAMELHEFRTAFVDQVLVNMTNGGASTRDLKAYLKSNLEAWRSRRQWLKTGRIDRALIAKPLRKAGQFFS